MVRSYPYRQHRAPGISAGLSAAPEGGWTWTETPPPRPTVTPMSPLWAVVSLAGTIGGVYHGYKRNNSIGWGIWWGFLGGLAPVIVLPLAAAQGFGKRNTGR